MSDENLASYEQGLLGNELFAIAGCKKPSNAAKEHSGTFKELRDKSAKLRRLIQHHLKEHKRLDKAEAKDEERLKCTEQTINTLSNAADRSDNFLKHSSPRMGRAQRKNKK